MARIVAFESSKMLNFRDFGGYPTMDGRTVKRGIFYRSGALGYLTLPQDQALFQSLHLHTVIDLRSQQERLALPDICFGYKQRIEKSAMKDKTGQEVDFRPRHMFHFSLLWHKPRRMSLKKYFLQQHYGSLVFHNEAYQVMFSIMQSYQVPMLIHCSAGKDRTGVGAALILLLLGVDRETILHDYCLTNRCRQAIIHDFLYRHRFLIRLFPSCQSLCLLSRGVLEESLTTCFAMIDARYQDLETFFEKEYSLSKQDIENLRDIYLE